MGAGLCGGGVPRRLFQIDGAVGGGEAGVFDGAGAGEAILDADDVGGVVGEGGGVGGFSVYNKVKLTVVAGDFKGGPLGQVAAEAREVGIPAAGGGAGGKEVEVADAGPGGEGDNKYIVFTLYQYLNILADAGALRGSGFQGCLESKVRVFQVSQLFHIK